MGALRETVQLERGSPPQGDRGTAEMGGRQADGRDLGERFGWRGAERVPMRSALNLSRCGITSSFAARQKSNGDRRNTSAPHPGV